MEKKAPCLLKHKPIITVDYERKDANAGDAKFMTLGSSSWNAEVYSAKVFRWAGRGKRWSRQAEELPLWRVLDLATLLIATINGKESSLGEFVQNPSNLDGLKDFINENMNLYAPRLEEIKRLLNTKSEEEDSSKSPNIFEFATSELSQDAIIAWLIKSADLKYSKEDPSLFNVAQHFVQLLIGDNNYDIRTINVGRQKENIDVWVEINENAFLVIEDKIDTSIHDDQLIRYKKIAEEEYNGKRNKLFYAYVKTGNEPLSVLKKIETIGYKTISRQDIIKCLEEYKGENDIINHYLDHLKRIEAATQSFEILPVLKWGWHAWQGFYKKLESKLDFGMGWGYVANPSGGFLGAWWHWIAVEGGEIYLQFEHDNKHDKLCFKVNCKNERNRSQFRWKQYEKLMSIAKQRHKDEIKKPARFGAGECMTIAVVDAEYLFGKDLINIDKVVEKLKEYQEIVDLCAQ